MDLKAKLAENTMAEEQTQMNGQKFIHDLRKAPEFAQLQLSSNLHMSFNLHFK